MAGQKQSDQQDETTDLPGNGNSSRNFSPSVSTRAIKHFRSKFSGARNEKWYTVSFGYMVKFVQDDTPIRVEYDKRGKWKSTQRVYGISNAPREVLKVIQSNYFGYEIILIQEVETRLQTIFLAKVRDKDSLWMLKIVHGVIEDQMKYTRG